MDPRNDPTVNPDQQAPAQQPDQNLGQDFDGQGVRFDQPQQFQPPMPPQPVAPQPQPQPQFQPQAQPQPQQFESFEQPQPQPTQPLPPVPPVQPQQAPQPQPQTQPQPQPQPQPQSLPVSDQPFDPSKSPSEQLGHDASGKDHKAETHHEGASGITKLPIKSFGSPIAAIVLGFIILLFLVMILLYAFVS